MTRRLEVYNYFFNKILIALISSDLLGDAFKMQLMSKSSSVLYMV